MNELTRHTPTPTLFLAACLLAWLVAALSPSHSLARAARWSLAPPAGPWALAAVLAPATEDAAAAALAHGRSSMRDRTARRAAAPLPPTPVRLPLRRRPRAARAASGSARGRRRDDGGVPRRVFIFVFVVVVARRRAPRPPAAGLSRGEVIVILAAPTPAAREVELRRGAGAPGRQARGPQWPQPGLQSVGRQRERSLRGA